MFDFFFSNHANSHFIFRNILCGTLHCQEGSAKPRIPQSTYSSHTQTVDGKEVQCKVMSGTFDPELTVDYGMVQDGTKCGDLMICMNQTCINTSPLKTYTRCPVDPSNMECSGRGVSYRGSYICIRYGKCMGT